MNRERIGDVVLGVTAISIGAVPLGLVATGRTELVVSGYGLGTLGGTLDAILGGVLALCGSVLVASGLFVIRYGRTDRNSTTIY